MHTMDTWLVSYESTFTDMMRLLLLLLLLLQRNGKNVQLAHLSPAPPLPVQGGSELEREHSWLVKFPLFRTVSMAKELSSPQQRQQQARCWWQWRLTSLE